MELSWEVEKSRVEEQNDAACLEHHCLHAASQTAEMASLVDEIQQKGCLNDLVGGSLEFRLQKPREVMDCTLIAKMFTK